MSDFEVHPIGTTRELAALKAAQHPAISLTRIGIDCVVAIEVNGQWVPVIHDNGDMISHIVEPLGIEEAIAKPRRGRQVSDWKA